MGIGGFFLTLCGFFEIIELEILFNNVSLSIPIYVEHTAEEVVVIGHVWVISFQRELFENARILLRNCATSNISITPDLLRGLHATCYARGEGALF